MISLISYWSTLQDDRKPHRDVASPRCCDLFDLENPILSVSCHLLPYSLLSLSHPSLLFLSCGCQGNYVCIYPHLRVRNGSDLQSNNYLCYPIACTFMAISGVKVGTKARTMTEFAVVSKVASPSVSEVETFICTRRSLNWIICS